MHITGNATTRAVTGFPARNPGSSFASVCDTFCISRTLMEFTRVARISDALLLSAPVLNQGPSPPPALPDFLSITGLCATPGRFTLTVTGLRLIAMTDHAIGLPVLRAFPLCACCRHHPGTAHT
jgi:hypothetical protein